MAHVKPVLSVEQNTIQEIALPCSTLSDDSNYTQFSILIGFKEFFSFFSDVKAFERSRLIARREEIFKPFPSSKATSWIGWAGASGNLKLMLFEKLGLTISNRVLGFSLAVVVDISIFD